MKSTEFKIGMWVIITGGDYPITKKETVWKIARIDPSLLGLDPHSNRIGQIISNYTDELYYIHETKCSPLGELSKLEALIYEI